jgi:Na+-driven multidrug efflux pump
MMMGRLWCIRIPMLYIMKNYTHFQPSSVWFAMISSNFLICSFGLFMYFKGNWTETKIENYDTSCQKA